jgi:hypothetical protein
MMHGSVKGGVGERVTSELIINGGAIIESAQ